MGFFFDGTVLHKLYEAREACVQKSKTRTPPRASKGKSKARVQFFSPVLIDSDTESAVELEGWDSIEEESDTSSIESCITVETPDRGPTTDKHSCVSPPGLLPHFPSTSYYIFIICIYFYSCSSL